tara:strand:- start:102 stop:623 length:522 start_codon:yes stop_codon:yes gene_type:complete
MKVVRINIDGTMNDIDIDFKKSWKKTLEKTATSKGSTDFKELYQWKHSNKTYFCYGWYDGDSGFENKHDLIPSGVSSFLEENSDEKLLFGDIFMISMEKKKYSDFCVSDYAELYEIMFEGFDDCESDEELSEDEEDELNTEDEDFIVDDDDMECETDETYSDEELDEDLNEYD